MYIKALNKHEQGNQECNYIVTYFTDVVSWRLSAAVVVKLVSYSTMHHNACLITAEVVGLVVAPPCIAACHNQPRSISLNKCKKNLTV